MTAVVFLDVDGVLNCPDTWKEQKGQGSRVLSAGMVARFVGALRMTRARVVLSSTWRGLPDHVAHLRAYAPEIATAMHDDWCTRKTRAFEVRGNQIQDWLDAHPDVKVYAIVDDDDDMLPAQLPRLVHTNWQVGLTDDDVAKLVTLLTPDTETP